MAEEQDDSQKTEEPTQKRLDDAVKKGQVPSSREVNSFFILLIFSLLIAVGLPPIMKNISIKLHRYISEPHLIDVSSYSVPQFSSELLIDILIIMATPLAIVIIAIFIAGIIQHGLLFSTESLGFKLERISPLQGIKRIFSLKSFVEFLKGIFKIALVGVIIFIAAYPEFEKFKILHSLSIIDIMLFLGTLATRVMIGICIFIALVAAVDFVYQKYEYIKSLRMSKQDIKEEFKQTEGNPEVKAKLREIRAERARNRMMSEVPNADVVLTNPTHYSVALKYDEKINNAPVLIAKGQDLIALKIREIAKENDIPIVENPPLTRALFSSVELDQEIPLEHYNAVAEVIKYVYKLKGKTKA
ncbi:flagellar biosynthesis protein FlhB [Rickettsiales bacterium]|nr:flagellar biosynthesis protein FlhB [Rickettsiales bacterium]